MIAMGLSSVDKKIICTFLSLEVNRDSVLAVILT
jgi:hypothetical protein